LVLAVVALLAVLSLGAATTGELLGGGDDHARFEHADHFGPR
jgi:hypothetical protein